MTSSHRYSLTISGLNNIHQGVHRAATLEDNIALVFYKDGEVLAKTNLAADRTSLYRSLETTLDKISLFCKRLGIKQDELEYDRSELTKLQKIGYKLLFLKKLLFEAFIPVQWCIVYKKTNSDGLANEIGNVALDNDTHKNKWRKIIPDSKVFQADPFIVYKDEKYYVFYEELKFENWHGYLRAAELDVENGKLINDKIILKLEHHLSFPNVFEEDGVFYMTPECADSHRVDLFECTDFPYSWEKKQTLLDNIQAVDSTLLKITEGSLLDAANSSPLKTVEDSSLKTVEDSSSKTTEGSSLTTKECWYLFTSEIVKGAGCNDELSIYKSTDLFNEPFIKLYDQPVISDVKNARMAGHFIQRNGEVFRVSQNCGIRYGHQANFNKVLQIEGGYREELIDTVTASQGALGFHTYNQAHGIIIGDMEIARFDWQSLNRFVGGNFRRLFKIILGKNDSGKD